MAPHDRQTGAPLTRRDMLAFGISAAALLAAPSNARAAPAYSSSTCIVRPEQTEGPYFVDAQLNRSDIRPDPETGAIKAGTPLALTFVVSEVSGGMCRPIYGAHIDVWHCDASGMYSDVVDPSFNTKGHRFLRGYQITNKSGEAEFATIYPGWYSGRAVHIHFKIRTNPTRSRGHEFTSQL